MGASAPAAAVDTAASVSSLKELSIEDLMKIEVTSVSKAAEPLSDAPAAVYVGLGAAAAGIWISPRAAAYGVAPALLAVLLISIRNAWDMVTWLAPRGGAEPPAPAPATGETPVKLD